MDLEEGYFFSVEDLQYLYFSIQIQVLKLLVLL